jgi:hypothetical protein
MNRTKHEWWMGLKIFKSNGGEKDVKGKNKSNECLGDGTWLLAWRPPTAGALHH